MAHNIDTTSPKYLVQLLAFVASLSEEQVAALPAEDSDDWFAAASELYLLSMGDDESTETQDKGPRTRSAKHYSVLLFQETEDGSISSSVVGSGFGPVGREALDPKKHSDAKKIETRGNLQVARLAAKGISAGIMRVETSDLPSMFAVQVPVAETAQETASA